MGSKIFRMLSKMPLAFFDIARSERKMTLTNFYFRKFLECFGLPELKKVLRLDRNRKFYFAHWGLMISDLMEIEFYEVYRELKGLDYVLELGASSGFSTYYLQSRNKRVLSYEASSEFFKYLKENKTNLRWENTEVFNRFVKSGGGGGN